MTHAQRLPAAIHAVALASRATLAVRHGQVPMDMQTKDDKSPVTVADYAAQATAVVTLQKMLAEPLCMLGEEDAAQLRENARLRASVLAAARLGLDDPSFTEAQLVAAVDAGAHAGADTSGDYWTLDPIDGTKGFLRGGQYAVCLAWIEKGEVALGVLGCPAMALDGDPAHVSPVGSYYAAVKDAGAWGWSAHDPFTAARRLRLPAWNGQSVRVAESVEAEHSAHGEQAQVMANLGVPVSSVRLDSQCKYAVVASGRADAYLRFPTNPTRKECIWDHATGVLLVDEAGGETSDARGAKLDFGHGKRLEKNHGIIACAKGLRGKLVI